MNNCKTCKWWKTGRDGLAWIPARNIMEPYDEATYERLSTPEQVRERFGYNIGYCESAKVLFYEFPSRDGACVVDGSMYDASLVTAEEFGCVLHEEK